MKKIIYGIIAIAAIAVFHSCGPNYDIDGEAVSSNLKVAGQVIDLQGNPIPNVEVKIDGKVTTTDDNGFFFSSISSASKTYFIKFTKDGYFPNIRSGKVLSDEIKVKVALLSFNDVTTKTINTTVGGGVKIQTPYGNADINFPAGLKYIVKSTHENYSGNLTVYGFYVDPTNNNYVYLVPGGKLLGIKNKGLKKLMPYGGIFVMLIDNHGRKVDLSSENTTGATVSLPIPTSLQASAPTNIDFWSDDFNKSFCYMAGSGSRDQDKYIAEVRHFSYWRAAIDYDNITTYMGTVTDDAGRPVPGVRVRINNIYVGVTNINGKYKIEAPRGLQYPSIIIAPEDYAGQGYDGYTDVIVDQDVYTYNITLPSVQTLSGRIVDCDGKPVSAYVTFSYMDQQYNNVTATTLAPRGIFRLYIPTDITSGHLRIISQKGNYDEDIYNLSGSTVDNFNTYYICNQDSASITISGGEFGNETTYDSLSLSGYYGSDFSDVSISNNNFSLFFSFPSQIGSFTIDTSTSYLHAFGSSYSHAFGSFYVNTSGTSYEISSGTLNITELDTASKRISGTISNAQAVTSSGDTTYVINGNFSMKLNMQ
jgi:hypothetical protein